MEENKIMSDDSKKKLEIKTDKPEAKKPEPKKEEIKKQEIGFIVVWEKGEKISSHRTAAEALLKTWELNAKAEEDQEKLRLRGKYEVAYKPGIIHIHALTVSGSKTLMFTLGEIDSYSHDSLLVCIYRSLRSSEAVIHRAVPAAIRLYMQNKQKYIVDKCKILLELFSAKNEERITDLLYNILECKMTYK
jgi:hypothetical protein